MTGSSIFPNEEIAELELPVDQFFACRLGRPSYEISDVNTTTREYKAIYTAALIGALEGADRAVLDAEGYVRPRPLKDFLRLELARRLRDLPFPAKLVQVPDAHIASDEHAWISHIVGGGAPLASEPGGGHGGGAAPPAPKAVRPEADGASPGGEGASAEASDMTPPVAIGATFNAMLSPILTGSLERFDYMVREKREADEPRLADLAIAVDATASPFGPTRSETQCGIKVRGARIIGAVGKHGVAEQVGDDLVRINSPGRRDTVLVVLDRGTGVAIPTIPEFIAAVTVDQGEVVDLAYEPSEGTSRWKKFAERAREVRALRAVAASASREGAFELEGENALKVARRMQYAKGIDPALAIYAAYAYADIGRRDLIRQIYKFMFDDLGAVLFDVALLAREPDGRSRVGAAEMFGFAPLLAQGWALLPSSRGALPPLLEGLERQVLPGSLWTLYNEDGVDRIRHAIATGQVA